MNGRVYDPTIGRFLSPDPFIQAPNNTQSYNRYSYVFNNPLSYTDPTGYQSEINEVVVTAEQTGGGCDGCSFEIDTGGVGVSGINPSLISGVIAINHNGIAYIPDKATQRKAKRRARTTGKDQVITRNGKVKSLNRQDSKSFRQVLAQKVVSVLSVIGQQIVPTAKAASEIQSQKNPTYGELDSHYPKSADGGDMDGTDVFKMVGGEVYDLQQKHGYTNACALRVSIALNGAGATIPDIQGTFKGADGRNYFLSAARLESYMTNVFGQPSTYYSNFSNQLQGQRGIYIMRPNYPAQFGATGHATLFNGSGCIGGHCYFNAIGGTYKVSLWAF